MNIDYIFIGGCPRSGTTHLAKRLGDRINNSFIPPELDFKSSLINSHRSSLSSFLYDINIVNNSKKIRKNNILIKPRDLSISESSYEYLTIYEKIKLFSDSLVIKLISQSDIKVNSSEKIIVIDHTPSNVFEFEVLQHVSRLAKPCVNIIRDGRACYASLKKLSWGPNTAKDAAFLWMQSISHGKLSFALSINYEELIQGDVGINEFLLKNSLSPDIWERRRLDLPNYTERQHELVNKLPDTSRIDSWKNELTEREVLAFEYYTKNILTLLGYKLESRYEYEIKWSDRLIELRSKLNRIFKRL